MSPMSFMRYFVTKLYLHPWFTAERLPWASQITEAMKVYSRSRDFSRDDETKKDHQVSPLMAFIKCLKYSFLIRSLMNYFDIESAGLAS